jgi:Fe-Mn family superoxide dismutase
MELHHQKHHQAYITNLDKALDTLHSAIDTDDIPAQIALQPAIKFNGGGHINHTLFWQNLVPASSTQANASSSAPKLIDAINTRWGSLQAFKEKFTTAALGIQGSGWAWLVLRSDAEGLSIVTTKDQDPVIGAGEVPVLGVDMWEHAYYLQYLNGKPAYLENIWKVMNWRVAEERFLGTRDDVFKELRAVI